MQSPVEYEWQFEPDIQVRVDNWIRWAKPNAARITSCRSIECRYKPPPMYEPPALHTIIDTLDAPRVEEIIITLPKRFKVVFVFAHISPGYNFRRQCQKAGISERQYNETLNAAKQMVQNKLKKLLHKLD